MRARGMRWITGRHRNLLPLGIRQAAVKAVEIKPRDRNHPGRMQFANVY